MQQHVDSRLFFPNLLNIALAFLTDWNVKYEMVVTFLLACLVSFNVYQLGKMTIEGSQIKRLMLLLLSNLFIFAPVQAYNWLWGLQYTMFVPIACITTALLVVAKLSLSTKTKASMYIALCMMFATISTFSFANGILAWIVVFPAIALSKTGGGSAWKRWFVLAWVIGFGLNVALYFSGYQRRFALSEALLHPIQTLHYLLAFLGAPYSFGLPAVLSSARGAVPYDLTVYLATITGAALLSLFVALCIYLSWSLKNSSGFPRSLGELTNSALLQQSSVWLMIGAYSIFSGLLSAFGRVGLGVGDALGLRHLTHPLFLAVSLIYLTPIVFSNTARNGDFSRSKLIATTVGTSLIAIVVFFNVLTSVHWVMAQIPRASLERLNGKACLLLFDVVGDDACVTEKLFTPGADKLRRWGVVKMANDLGFLTPGLIESDKVRDIGIGRESEGLGYGFFDILTKQDDGSYLAAGWAISPEEERPADAVLLAYEDANGEPTVFAITDVRVERPDIVEGLDDRSYILSGWQEYFRPSAVPANSTEITAWAFDVETERAFKLNDTHILEKSDLQRVKRDPPP
jgi:hypothetical protein